nr:PREDICTED: hydrophobic protein OSR8-like [Musa acuminata subsp. malaccensis]
MLNVIWVCLRQPIGDRLCCLVYLCVDGSFQNSTGDCGKEKMAGCCCRVLEILCAILLPPLGVCFRHGCCSLEFFICLVLTILGYIPGVIYALYVILCVQPVDYYVLV